MRFGIEVHFDLTICGNSSLRSASVGGLPRGQISDDALPGSLHPRGQFRTLVPDALAAAEALVHVQGVALPCIEQGIREAGKPQTMRATLLPVVGEGFVRELFVFNHGLPPPARHQPGAWLRRLIVAKRVEMRPFAGAY